MYLPDIHHQISNDLPEIFPPTLGRWAMARASGWPSCSAQSRGVLWCWRDGDGDGDMPPLRGTWEGKKKDANILDKIKYSVCT